MIARLSLTQSGPAIRRSVPGRRPNRPVIVVSRELYTDCPATDWPASLTRAVMTPGDGSGAAIVYARSGGLRLIAAAHLHSTAERLVPGHRLLLVPEDSIGRARRAPRWLRRVRLRRARFRVPGIARRRLAASVALLLLVASAIVLAAAVRSADRIREVSAVAIAGKDERARLHARLDELVTEHDILARERVPRPAAPTLLPGDLTAAVVGLLAPAERLHSLTLSGSSLTLVTGRSASGNPTTRNLAGRIDALPGIDVMSSSVRYADSDERTETITEVRFRITDEATVR